MIKFVKFTEELFDNAGMTIRNSRLVTTIIVVASVLTAALLIYWFMSRVLDRYVIRLVRYTDVKWDDIIFNDSVLRSVWQLLLAIILMAFLPDAFIYYPDALGFVRPLLKILVVLALMMLFVHLLGAAFELFSSFDRYADKTFKGLCQLMQLAVIVGSVIIIASILIGRDPLVIVSGLGAMAAVLMLVFQDTILGFIAGIQLTANDMLRPGDWITAPKANINGTVQEVTLTTVKVQNFDQTIVTIPPYTLVKDSFQNWRGMIESGGRRIMRSISIDMNSVRFLSDDEIPAFESQKWFPEKLDGPVVNLSLFRRYLEWHITQLPSMCPDLTYMVRELQPTAQGLPVEIYFFTDKQEWTAYEKVQADFLDHIIASVNQFGLSIFQAPTGADIRHH